jgi:hypothetical protein
LDQDLQERTVEELFLCKISLKKKELVAAVVGGLHEKTVQSAFIILVELMTTYSGVLP